MQIKLNLLKLTNIYIAIYIFILLEKYIMINTTWGSGLGNNFVVIDLLIKIKQLA